MLYLTQMQWDLTPDEDKFTSPNGQRYIMQQDPMPDPPEGYECRAFVSVEVLVAGEMPPSVPEHYRGIWPLDPRD